MTGEEKVGGAFTGNGLGGDCSGGGGDGGDSGEGDSEGEGGDGNSNTGFDRGGAKCGGDVGGVACVSLHGNPTAAQVDGHTCHKNCISLSGGSQCTPRVAADSAKASESVPHNSRSKMELKLKSGAEVES